MMNLPYNHNYPPGYSHAEYEADEMEDKPLSKMDEWYIEFENNVQSAVYDVYIKSQPGQPGTMADGLTRQINDEAHKYFTNGIEPEVAADMINNLYLDECMKLRAKR